jgi:epoxyqueuosine reductase
LLLTNLATLKTKIQALAIDFGFQQATVGDIDTSEYFPAFKQWVEDGYHGKMSFLERNQNLRQYPDQLHLQTSRVISVRYNYLPKDAGFCKVLSDSNVANISRYALGRDYHKLMRKKLQQLACSISKECDSLDYRVFVDSAPVLESCLAEKSGLGWKGKHSLLINKNAGSWFFLGEIFINLPLEPDLAVSNECGGCTSCISFCPTNAIVAPYKVDARKCISYLTIENPDSIPIELRQQIGNRIYGCDDCQLACPWNRFAQLSDNADFSARHDLDKQPLLSLFGWTKEEFETKLQGSPIRRIGFERWQRNLAVAIGNADPNEQTISDLRRKKDAASPMVAEHIDWAIKQQEKHLRSPVGNDNTKLIRTIAKLMPRDA